MQRFLIIGCSGSGKSTLAAHLAGRTGLPHISLDREFWQPGWKEMPQQRWRGRVAELVAGDRWILDGNFAGSLDLRLLRADTLVWFERPRHVCIRRVLKRVMTTYGRVRADMAPGCPERLDLDFLRWVWNFNREERPRMVAAVDRHVARLRPVILRNDWDALRFLDSVPRIDRA